jgi:hypothetical protein
MARIRLITTGRMEKEALGVSLGRLFPGHEFECKEHIDGFTSARLPPASPTTSAPLNLDKFAATLIGVFDPGNRRDRPRPDFVIGIEDVELCNADDPARITGALRQTLERRLDQWPGGSRTVEGLREALESKVSFHLMSPMTEALFFADAAALARATAPAPDRPNRFDPTTCDVESFYVGDPDYLETPADPEGRCRWRTREGRQGHPKRYLIYLTDPGTGGRYRETEHGVDALRSLDWPSVVGQPQRTRFARSLLADLADMLGPPDEGPLPSILEGDTHPLTWPPPRRSLLRNL